MSKTLLVVDDAMITREIIKEEAINDGWEIVGEAENGQDAIELYKERRPDVVTIDIVMPEYDGIYGLTGIIEEDKYAKVVVVSAIDQSEMLKQAIQCGAKDFIIKPFDRTRLVNAIKLAYLQPGRPGSRTQAGSGV